MSGDFSRKTFDRKKHYSGVLLQQGRVQLDADWNEQLDIQQHRTLVETRDVIGVSGVPKKKDSFRISLSADGSDLLISPGHIYVDGHLCELESASPASYLHQPYYPDPDRSYFISGGISSPVSSPPDSPLSSPPDSPVSSPPGSPPGGGGGLGDGSYLVYVDAWQREINYLNDPLIHEVALGEADTTTRTQNIWQVKVLKVTPPQGSPAGCKSTFPEWDQLVAYSTGQMKARTKPATDPANPCLLPPRAGYRRLENQLYRVEVQRGSVNGAGTFKWSRDNATVETIIEHIDGSVLTVRDTGKDDTVLCFAPGQWVEIVDETSELTSSPHPLMTIDTVDVNAGTVTLTASAMTYKNGQILKLRRWDQPTGTGSADGIDMGTGWIDIEDGIQVSFASGSYRPGDYWLIPARTATGEIEWPPYAIPNTAPLAELPRGIHHHYCRLALLQVQNGIVALKDCRPLFPSLTELTAADVSYDNGVCNLQDAKTVQDALNLLCAANDLRKHNKLLHGYGVVCGLVVKCGVARRSVTIESGHALDCEGNLLPVKRPFEYQVLESAAAKGLLDATGNGRVALRLTGVDAKGAGVIECEQYVQKSFWDEVLEGSLLKDFYDKHIQNLVLFYTSQMPVSLVEKAPVPIDQRRLTTLINLFSQLINSASGPYAFLSGLRVKGGVRSEKDCGDNSDEKKYEDKILWCLYNDLKKLLASETYCAMFDNDRPFPDYTLDPGLATIFGPALKIHTRLRIHPSGLFAYTCGKNNKIYVYDLVTNEFMQSLVFPASANIVVGDVAISSAGTTLYAVGVLADKDSVFAVATIDVGAKTHTWSGSGTSVNCGLKCPTLAIGPAAPGSAAEKLYTTGVAKGVYEVKNIGSPTFSLTLAGPVAGFNATGALVLSDDGARAYAAASSAPVGTVSASFDHVASIILNTSPSSKQDYTFMVPFTGSAAGDDLAFYDNNVYVTGTANVGGLQRVLAKCNIMDGTNLFKATLHLDASSVMRLAPLKVGDKQYMLVALSDKSRVVRVDLKNFVVDLKFSIPVQLFPMGMAVNANKTVYVLNTVVNTLTEIDVKQVFRTGTPPNYTHTPPVVIAKYRDGVINAYKDLFSHFLQYLKDGFCESFLIDCPECGPDDQIYLGTVEIRNNKVYKICNFSKRKYVKTFRTWEYWLSTVPVLPMIKRSFTKFCCKVFN